jgi:hypothetical protein
VIDRENRVVNFYLQFLFLSILFHFQVNHTHKIEMSASYTTSKIPFEHYASQYRCCCNSVHVKQGTQIIAVIQTICAIFGLIVFVFSHKLDAVWGLLEIASILGEIIVLTILFLGIKKENPHFLLPYLVYESLMILVSIGFIASGIFAFVDPQGRIGHVYTQVIDISIETNPEYKLNEETAVKLIAAFTIVMFAIATCVYIWFIHVVYKYYLYLRDLNQARANNDLSMRYSPKITVA